MPTAGPLTAAITGLGKPASARMKRQTGASGSEGGALRKSPMSLPAENTVSCPWNTSTRTAASVAACVTASAMVAYMAEVMEFLRSRRLKLTVQTPPSVWTRISLMVFIP